MKSNPESTKLDRLRMAFGTILALIGAVVLILAGVLFGFSNLTLVAAGLLFIVSGLFIAGSARLAELITNLLRF